MRLALVLVAAIVLSACGPETGMAGVWVPFEAIEGPLAPELGPSPPAVRSTPTDPRGPLRVVTYNVADLARPEELADRILAHPDLGAADVLLIQEAQDRFDEGESRARRLARRLGMTHAYAPGRVEGRGTEGLAVLSRYAILAAEIMELPNPSMPGPAVRRIALAVELDVGDRPLRVIVVHLDTRMNLPDRIRQLHPAVIGAPGEVLFGGDFNTNNWVWAEGSVPLNPVESVADTHQAPLLDDYMRHLGFTTPTANYGPTAQLGGELDFRLDSIYPRELVSGRGGVARDVGFSDHWPVWVDVARP